MSTKFYAQTVFKKTFSNGAVRFEYLPTKKLYYQEFEYDEHASVFTDASEQRRYEHVREKLDQIIELVLTPAPDLLIYENGKFVNEIFRQAYEGTERVQTFLKKFDDVGVLDSDDLEVVVIHALEVRVSFDV